VYRDTARCRTCLNRRARERYAQNPEYRAAIRTQAAQWAEANREARNAISRAYGKRNPEKNRAHRRVQIALKDGRLVRPSRCEACSKRCTPEAHHDDYSKALDVRWLCKGCHERYHLTTIST